VRVCLDANVLVSALAARGLAADVVRATLAEHELIVPEVVVTEVCRVLRSKLKVPSETVEAVEQLLRSQIPVPKPKATLDVEIRDAADAWVLASAVAGAAEVLVTGDNDLLTLGDSAPLPMLTPRAFWEFLRHQSSEQPGR
jgi:putative PIN family toxin of toxin-antitoxin system